MANKSIISIDVNDSKFKEFAAAFAKYQEALKAMPKDWDKSNSASGKHAADTEKALKKIQKAQKDLNKDIADGLSVLKGVSKVTGDIAANFASSAVSIAKWLTLSAIGSGFGLGALAGSATNTRKSATGLGVTSGELRAANVNYGNILSSPEGSLSKIADAQNDLMSQQILTRLGGKSGQDAAQMLPTLFKNAIQEFKANGQNVQTADALGLTKLFDMQDLRRGAAASADELNKMAEAFQRDSKLLSINPADEKIMGDFWNQLKRSGESLETNLIKAIAPLTPELTKLSEAITTAITDFIGSKEVKAAIQDFTKWLGSEDAKKDLHEFMDGLSSMGKAMLKIGKFFGFGNDESKPKTEAEAAQQNTDKLRNSWFVKDYGSIADQKKAKAEQDQLDSDEKFRKNSKYKIAWDSINHPEMATFLSQLEKNNKLPSGLLAQVRQAESGGDNNAISSKGAQGAFQFMPETSKEYGVKNPFDVEEEGSAAAKKIKHLMDKYKNNMADTLAAYNWGEGNLDKFIAGKKGFEKLPDETNNYLHKFNIYVNSAAGSDLVVSTNATK